MIPDILDGIATTLITSIMIEDKLILFYVCVILYFIVLYDAGLELSLLDGSLAVSHVLVSLNLDY